MRRRDFVGLVGGAAAWPLTAEAQQRGPTIGWLYTQSPEAQRAYMPAFHRVAPRLTRVAVVRTLYRGGGAAGFAAIQAVAPLFGVEVSPLNLSDPADIERGIAAFARRPNGGLIVTLGTAQQRGLIVALCAEHEPPLLLTIADEVIE